jgi:uncharacterized protein (TIRG00374 family)
MQKLLRNTVVYLIAGLLLWYLFRDTDWLGLTAAIRDAHWGWLALSVSLVVAAFFTRVQRWSYIVRSVKPVSYRHLFSATQIGFLGNFTLPGRVGELIRAVVLSRLSGLPLSKCFAFLALDRVSDLFGLLAVMLIAVIAFRPDADIVLPKEIWSEPIPRDAIVNGALLTAGVLVAIVVAFVLLHVNQRFALAVSDWLTRTAGRALSAMLRALTCTLPARYAARLLKAAEHAEVLDTRAHAMLQHFADGMHVFRSARDIVKSLLFTGLTWMLGLLSYVCVVWAFGLGSEMPWYTGFMIMTLLTLFISVPGPPGFVGTFHVGIVGALVVSNPQVDLSVAKAVAIVAHLINLLAVVLVGLYCLHRERMGLLELRKEIAEIRGEDE